MPLKAVLYHFFLASSLPFDYLFAFSISYLVYLVMSKNRLACQPGMEYEIMVFQRYFSLAL